ncbi:MAG: glycosyltransferase family 2 protein, partial [Planctomycetes bacterium]|nr:glycosyltransferase family 2 protein [Planctomycetota bacterium]
MVTGACPISVVIPAYQAASLLRRTVGDVLNQTLAPSEIIVVDDGSTDATAEVARSFGERVHYVYQENAGVAAARNRGIAAASAEWIAFLDADDGWSPDHLERCWDVIQRDRSLAWCCGGHTIISLDGSEQRMPTKRWMQLKSTRETSLLFFDAVVAGAPLQTSGFLISQDVIRAVGLFDPNLRCGEDRDYWYRIALHYPRIGFVWPPTVRYIQTEGSVTWGYGDEADRLLETVRRNVARLDGLE